MCLSWRMTGFDLLQNLVHTRRNSIVKVEGIFSTSTFYNTKCELQWQIKSCFGVGGGGGFRVV